MKVSESVQKWFRLTRAEKSLGELSGELGAFNELDGDVDNYQSRTPC
jgi:hypothetical protein